MGSVVRHESCEQSDIRVVMICNGKAVVLSGVANVLGYRLSVCEEGQGTCAGQMTH